jgi:SOS response regulatory protein OraA/RecX
MIEKFLPNEVSEIQNARETLAKKLRGEELPKDWKEKQKLAAFLARRGFDLDVIREVMKF